MRKDTSNMNWTAELLQILCSLAKSRTSRELEQKHFLTRGFLPLQAGGWPWLPGEGAALSMPTLCSSPACGQLQEHNLEKDRRKNITFCYTEQISIPYASACNMTFLTWQFWNLFWSVKNVPSDSEMSQYLCTACLPLTDWFGKINPTNRFPDNPSGIPLLKWYGPDHRLQPPAPVQSCSGTQPALRAQSLPSPHAIFCHLKLQRSKKLWLTNENQASGGHFQTCSQLSLSFPPRVTLTHSPRPPQHAEDVSTYEPSQPFGRSPEQRCAGPELPACQDRGRAEQRAASHKAPLQMSPSLDIQTAPAAAAEPELGFTSLHPAAALLLWPSPNRYRHRDGIGGWWDILWGIEDSLGWLHWQCCAQIQLEKAQNFLCTRPEEQVPGAGQQIILCSDGSSKSHVSLSFSQKL